MERAGLQHLQITDNWDQWGVWYTGNDIQMRELPRGYSTQQCGPWETSSYDFFLVEKFIIFLIEILAAMGLPRWCSRKESTCQSRRHERHGFDPCVWKIPCRRVWRPTPVFLPGESQEQRSLVGYSPWNFKELDTTESACMHWFLFLKNMQNKQNLSS